IDPEVSDVRFDDTISFSVYVEVKPDVVVNKYKDIVVKKVEPEPVTDQMVQDVLSEREKRKEFASLIIDPEKRLAWEKQIRQQLEQLSAQIAQQKEQDQLWKQLFENSNVEIPEKLLLQRAQYLTQQQLRYIDTQNKTNEEIEKIAKKLFEEMKPIAEEQLKKYFILSKIAEMEKIEVSEEDVNREIERICLTSGEDFEKVKKQLIANDKLEDIKNDLKIDKALNLVKNNAQNIKKIILPGEEKNELRTQGQV
ncbi:MAG TPA: hypothetical protein PKX05_05445, partial [bacterium]|nr:hypothetical protein [bacterium]